MHNALAFQARDQRRDLGMAARGLEDQHGPACRGGLADHVGGVGRDHHRIGIGEQREEGILARAIPPPAAIIAGSIGGAPAAAGSPPLATIADLVYS